MELHLLYGTTNKQLKQIQIHGLAGKNNELKNKKALFFPQNSFYYSDLKFNLANPADWKSFTGSIAVLSPK